MNDDASFRVLVLGKLLPHADYNLSPAWTTPRRFAKASFASDKAALGIAHTLGTPGPSAPSLVADILSSMDDNAPAVTPTAHAELPRLSRVWAGLSFLVERAHETASVWALDADADDLAEVAERVLATNPDAFDVIVVDHEFAATPRDLAGIEALAQVGERNAVPVIAGGSAALLGFDDLEALAATSRVLADHEEPRASALRNLAAREPTRFIALALGGVHACSAPFALGALVLGNHANTGWGSGLAVIAHGDVKSALSPQMPRATAQDAGKAGLVALCSTPNGSLLAESATVLFRGPKNAAGRSAAAQLTLDDQLFVSRLSKTVQDVARALRTATDSSAARDVARIAFAELFEGAHVAPAVHVALADGVLEVTVQPNGFLGVKLPEVSLAARVGA
jgi:hypothetical protein